MPSEMLKSGTVITGLENRSTNTNRNRISRFAVGSGPRISMAADSIGAVAGNSCMPFLLSCMGYLVLCAADAILCDRVTIEWHVRPEIAPKHEFIQAPSTRLSRYFSVMTQAKNAYCKRLRFYNSFKPTGGTEQHILIIKHKRHPLPLAKTNTHSATELVAILFHMQSFERNRNKRRSGISDRRESVVGVSHDIELTKSWGRIKRVARRPHQPRQLLSQCTEPGQSNGMIVEKTLLVLHIKIKLTKAHTPAYKAAIGFGGLHKPS